MAQVIYIRTSDGVIVRFDSPDALKTWLLSGRVSAADRYLDADQTWRPVADLLNVDGAFRSPAAQSATTPAPATAGSRVSTVSTPLPSPIPGAAPTPAPRPSSMPSSHPLPPPPPVPTEPVTVPMFDTSPPISTPAARVGTESIRRPFVPTITEPFFVSDEPEPGPVPPPPEPPRAPADPEATERPIAPPPRRPLRPSQLQAGSQADQDIEDVPTRHLEDRPTRTEDRVEPELIITPSSVGAKVGPSGPGPGPIPIDAGPEPGPVHVKRSSSKAWPTDVAEPDFEVPRRGHPVAWTIFVVGVLVGGGAIVLDQWGSDWGIPAPWKRSDSGTPDAGSPASQLPAVPSPDAERPNIAIPDPGSNLSPDSGLTPSGSAAPDPSLDAGRGTDSSLPKPPPDRPEPSKRPAVAESTKPVVAEPAGFDGHMAAGQRLMASDVGLALTHFQAAAQLAPGRPEPRTKMGDCEMRRGNASAAAVHYQAALNAFPSYGPAIIGLARAHARLGHDADARNLYRKYLEINRTGTNADEARRVLGEIPQ